VGSASRTCAAKPSAVSFIPTRMLGEEEHKGEKINQCKDQDGGGEEKSDSVGGRSCWNFEREFH